MATYNAATGRSYTQPGQASDIPVTATMATGYKGPPMPSKPLPVPTIGNPVGGMVDLRQNAQNRTPFTPNNGNPRGANNMPSPSRYPVPQQGQNPSTQRRAYLNNVSGQQSDLGRYRPPTLAGNGNDPMNWNDYGGYDYNLPSAYGPTPNTATRPGPYGGYPQYLQPNWRNMIPGGG